MSRRTRRQQRQSNVKKEIKWAASLHDKLVQIKPPESKHTVSEANLAKRVGTMGLAFAVAYGNGALLKVFVLPGEFADIRWHLRKYVREASEEEMVMARLRSELPDSSMLDQGQIILCSVPQNKKELRKAIENRSNK